MTTETYYDTLGLAPFAGGAMVDQAYWHLAKTYQALVDADPRARQALDELNAAYAVLGTPRLRDAYDATLRIESPRRGLAKPSQDHTTGKPRFSLKWPFGREEKNAPADAAHPALRLASVDERAQAAPGAKVEAPRLTRKPDVQDLHTSTARMLERWRATAASATKAGDVDEAVPDMTLVDIFKSEQDLEAREDPLAAVMDILKAPKGAVPAAPER